MKFTENKRGLWRYLSVFTLLIFISISAFAQNRSIRGKVIDASGNPFPGVSVREKNTTNGTATEINGTFALTVSGESKYLVFSFIGMETQEVNIENKTEIEVTLEENTLALDEVVVVGYGTLKKSDAATSTSTIKSKDLQNQSLTSVEQALQGRAAGVVIRTDSGEPGGGINVVIRGANSISGSNEPLYVVDGFPVNIGGDAQGDDASSRSNPLASLNPHDIESIDILKDASATSIYGSRGANGVILITTKQAKVGKIKIDYNAQLTLQSVDMGYKLLNSYDYASMNNEVARLKYPKLSESEMWSQGLFPYKDEVGSLTPKPENTTVSSDYVDAILRSPVAHNHQLTISGGTSDNSYLLALGYTSQPGVILGSDLQKGNVRANLKNKVLPRVTLNTTLGLNYTKNSRTAVTGANLQNGPLYNALRMRPLIPLYSEDGLPVSYDEDGNFIRNPIIEATDKYDEVFNRGGVLNAQATIDLGKGFIFNSRVGINSRVSNRDIFYPFSTAQGQSLNGQAITQSLNTQFFSTEHFLQYNRVIKKIHRINAVGGISYEYTDKRSKNTEQSDFSFDELGIDALALGNSLTRIGSNRTSDVLKSGFLRANYSLMNRYILNFTGRADGSSKFGANNKWGYFPSFSLAWRIGEESLLKKIDALNELKLRASWGLVGSQAIPSYRTADTYALDKYFISSQGYTATYASKLANPDLKWEVTESTNVGLDIAILKNKFNISFDAYVKNTRDLLFERTLPQSSGFATAWVNMGKIRNKGIELEISAYIIDNNNFQWNVSGNIGTTKTVLKSMGGLDYLDGPKLFNSLFTASAHRLVKGQEVGLLYGYESKGLIQVEDFVDYYGGNLNPQKVDVTYVNSEGVTVTEKKKSYIAISNNHMTPGQWKFKDQNNDDILTDEDKVYLGKTTPDFTFGFTSNFTFFKRFHLSMFLQGAIGHQILNLTNAATAGWIGANGRKDWYKNRWTLENQHNNPKYPAPGMSDATGAINSAMVEDGDYLKLQSLTLRYNVPLKKNKYFNKLDIYFTGSNLLTFTGYSGQDPEVNVLGSNFMTQGVDLGAYPRPRTFTFGIDVTF